MKFRDYYETLGVKRTATPEEIKAAYRRLARKQHPDVDKRPDAEERFKELGEAHEVLKDPEKRALYDRLGSEWKAGQDFKVDPNVDAGFEFRSNGVDFSDASDFFEALFGRRPRHSEHRRPHVNERGEDHHAKVLIDLEDAYRGARRTVVLRTPSYDPLGNLVMQEHRLDVNIPRGIQAGERLRLVGQGGLGIGRAAPGDLYLEIAFKAHRRFWLEGNDVFVNLNLAPWEAALGAKVEAMTPEGPVQLTIPPGSAAGRKMRLKGKGIPSDPPGDLYVVLGVVLPPAHTEAARDAYRALAKALGHNAPSRESSP